METVTITAPGFKKLIDELDAIADFDRQKILRFMGEEALLDINDGFENEQNPATLEKWKPSKRAIEEGGKTLQGPERRLRRSIDYAPVGDSSVGVGTPVVYAKTHMNGKRAYISHDDDEGNSLHTPFMIDVPARPFLGVRKDFDTRIMNMPEVRRMLRL